MSTKFFTNNDENTLLEKFKGVFEYNQNIEYFDALVGYFRASGYFRIRPFLDNVPKIRILVGINVDRLLSEANRKGTDFFSNQEKTKKDFIEKIKDDISKAKYDKDTEDGILQYIKDIVDGKIEVKAHPEKTIHAKVYILRPDPFNEHTPASVITGSSNLTDSGLGAGFKYNYEFNVQLNDYSDVKFATEEFEKLWADAVDILPADIEDLKKETYLSDEITPFQLYIKLLIEYFGKNIDYDPKSMGDLPVNFKKLSYQVDAVNEGFNMLLKHNGFFLSDVVGLGKTVVAAMVAKRFILENGRDYSKILVVYPPAVEKNWKDTFKQFEITRYSKFITNGSLHKIIDEDMNYFPKEEYDLIIVDEAHKFRNHSSDVFHKLQLICKSPRSNNGYLKGKQKKVIMVSATPLNNRPDDIFHQIQMFQDARRSTLPITNLTAFFNPLMEKYKELKRNNELDVDELRKIYEVIREKIIKPITIRRSRTDLNSVKAYRDDLAEQGIVFPTVLAPSKLEYQMDNDLNNLFVKTIFYLIGFSNIPEKRKKELEIAKALGVGEDDFLSYNRYQAIAGLLEEKRAGIYENAETVSKSLASIMKTQMIKRLESSFEAFRGTLLRFRISTERMIEMFENDKVFIMPDAKVNDLLDKGLSYDEIEVKLNKLAEENNKNKIFKSDDFQEGFLVNLKKDLDLLQKLEEDWSKFDGDPKWDLFIEKLEKEFMSKQSNLEQKLVIFSESKITVDYIAHKLKSSGRTDILAINSDNRQDKYETIVENFDANIPSEKQKNEYNIIITTEVLAEGVNLHRSNVVIHYDTPWNSTKLMQRIGRVNRIGTKAEKIYNYVFYPSSQGDLHINLNKTAFMKLQAFHTAFGEDNQVYSADEILDDVKLFSEEIQETKDEKLKYLHFLRNFKKQNSKLFKKLVDVPLKSRTGRNSYDINRSSLADGTVAFLKNSRKLEFFWINSENKTTEITPVEAFEIFEAEENEANTELPENHHNQVQKAVQHFEIVERQFTENQIDPVALGGVAQRSKRFLSELLKYPQVLENQKEDIKKIIFFINIGRYDKLSRDVANLEKKKNNLEQVIEELKKIAIHYNIPISDIDDDKNKITEIPQIIISESFK